MRKWCNGVLTFAVSEHDVCRVHVPALVRVQDIVNSRGRQLREVAQAIVLERFEGLKLCLNALGIFRVSTLEEPWKDN